MANDGRPDLGREPKTSLSKCASSTRAISCSAKFSALADLFREPRDTQVESVRILMSPCAGSVSHECSMFDTEIFVAGERALQWFENSGNICVLEAEHCRLFGGEVAAGRPPRVSPCAAIHLLGSRQAIEDEILGRYRDLGFIGSKGALDPTCPCHISNELDFVAHCLELSVQALPTAVDVASEFVSSHLFSWGIVFAAAVSALAEHPVTRFAGTALEALLFCEGNAEFERYRIAGRQLPT